MVVCELVLVFQEEVVHRPERPLGRGRLGGFAGQLGLGVYVVEW